MGHPLLQHAILRKNLEIEAVIVHPDFDISTSVNDVALLKLKTPLDLAKYTPVCLPERNKTFVGEIAWVYGWGQFINSTGPMSNVLREIAVQVISNQVCSQDPHWPGENFQGDLCAIGPSYYVHSCNGDSGGPLTIKQTDGRHTLIGVVSFGGKECDGVTLHFAPLFNFFMDFLLFSAPGRCLHGCVLP